MTRISQGKRHAIDAILNAFELPPAVVAYDAKLRRSVRIAFLAGADVARVDEVAGDTPIDWVTEGFTTRDDAEVTAALYAAIRGLPISRVDVPS